MRNKSVNDYGVVWIFRKKLFLKRKRCPHQSLYHATLERSNFGYLIMRYRLWDLRVQSRLHLGESNHGYN